MKCLVIINLLGERLNDSGIKLILKVNKIYDKFDLIIFNQKNSSNKNEKNKFIKKSENDYVINKTDYDDDSSFFISKLRNEETILNVILKEKKINDIYLCGIYIENEIFSTVLDGIKFRYNVFVISDIIIGKDEIKTNKAIDFLKKLGIKFIQSDDILN